MEPRQGAGLQSVRWFDWVARGVTRGAVVGEGGGLAPLRGAFGYPASILSPPLCNWLEAETES